MKSPLLIALLLTAFSSAVGYSQASASTTFSASVTIVEPIGITTASDLNFARIESGSGGTVILGPDDSRTAIGGVKLAEGESGTAATFEVVGQEGFAFDVSLPEGAYVLSNGVDEIVIRDFKSDSKTNRSFTGGAQVVKVGATMDVNPSQTPGRYTNQNGFTVTVNYN